jgi:hypothetical protein
MTFLAADEDFKLRTLAELQGPLTRLAYLVQLRDREGRYEHWGMTRAFGEAGAQAAIASSHTEVLSDVLTTPLAKLMREVESFGGHQDGEEVDPLTVLHERASDALPAKVGGGTASHLSFVLESLWAARNSKQASSHRDA